MFIIGLMKSKFVRISFSSVFRVGVCNLVTADRGSRLLALDRKGIII